MYGTTALIDKTRADMQQHHQKSTRPPPSKFDPYYPIVCAAIRKSQRIICSPRHYDPIMRAQIVESTQGGAWWRGAEQGFVNAIGEFLTREDALHIAKAHSQIRRRCGGDEHQLFSENLY